MRLVVFILCLSSLISTSQTLPPERSVDWTMTGLQDTSTVNLPVVLLQDRGAVADGSFPNDSILTAVLSELAPTGGVVLFPFGEFLFNNTIEIPNGVVLKGGGSENTILKMDINGVGNAIQAIGQEMEQDTSSFVEGALRDQTYLIVEDPSIFSPMEWVRTSMQDSDLITSSWALGTLGQIAQIASISGDTLFLRSPLRLDHPLSRSPLVTKLQPAHDVGLECLTIERVDNTLPQQSTNVFFQLAVNCWMQGVESAFCNYAHVELFSCSNMQVSGCYFHEAFGYGSGGQGYGIAVHYTSGQCLIQDNLFSMLRHSMLYQAGANGNVTAYNYSIDPFWTSSPSDAAGDIVLHGNYPHTNLFEQNIVQNIVIDNSHGPNGLHNTFLRNRAEGFGIFFAATNSPSQNFLGNEVTNLAFPYNTVNYTILGNDQFIHGNNDKGIIDPVGTETLPDISYAYMSRPAFVPANQWGAIGTPNTFGTASIPVKDRLDSGGASTSCEPATVGFSESSEIEFRVYPIPLIHQLSIESGTPMSHIRIIDVLGREMFFSNSPKQSYSLNTEDWPEGHYFLEVWTKDGQRMTKKVVKK